MKDTPCQESQCGHAWGEHWVSRDGTREGCAGLHEAGSYREAHCLCGGFLVRVGEKGE